MTLVIMAVSAFFLLFISYKLISNAVKRADYFHVIFVLLAFPFFALGILMLLYVSGIAPLLFDRNALASADRRSEGVTSWHYPAIGDVKSVIVPKKASSP
jgi:hypothetical protein